MQVAQPRYQPRTFNQNTAKELEASGLHPVLAKIYASRGIDSPEALNYVLKNVLPFRQMKNAAEMGELIADKIIKGTKFVIVADYDSDGATSCAIGVRAMRAFGANIQFMAPNRFKHGYGLTPTIVEELMDPENFPEKPECIITVDNGIASIDGIKEANRRGINVLVTDHHLPAIVNGQVVLPDAECIVNPNQPDCPFPSKSMAGCGVIFYVMLATKRALKERGWFDTHPDFELVSLLDLVALGTVADVVKLDNNNRILVNAGLQRIREGKAHQGIKELIKVAGKEDSKLVASDFGFMIGPRLNAAGRLDDMSRGIKCLLEDDQVKAKALAEELHAFNAERRKIEKDMVEEALTQTGNDKDTLEDVSEKTKPQKVTKDMTNSVAAQITDTSKYSQVLFNPVWHEGVIGILASRIKDRFNRPTIMFTRSHGSELKGSCRSIPPLHMRDALDLVYKQDSSLIKKFGGHSMAAGLTIMENKLSEFTVAFEDACRQLMKPSDLELVIETDGVLEPKDMTIELIEEIERSIWGQGFPEPVFQGEFKVLRQNQVGSEQQHARLTLGCGPNKDIKFDAILFNQKEPLPDVINALYTLNINRFNGIDKVQMRLEKFQAADAPVYVHSAEFKDGPNGLHI